MSRSCIVIPCYNEEGRLETEIFIQFIQEHENCDFFFVNDGSSDNTVEVLQELHQAYPDRLFYLNNEENKGKANAVRDGMMEVYHKNDYQHIGYLDADLEIPVDQLIKIMQVFEKPDVIMAMGSRIIRLGADIRREPLRHILGRIFATFTSNILGVPLYDSQCGAKIFRRDLIPVVFKEKFMTRWLFDVEILFRVKNSEEFDILNVIEVPLDRMVVKGSSRIKLVEVLQFPVELIRIYFKYKK